MVRYPRLALLCRPLLPAISLLLLTSPANAQTQPISTPLSPSTPRNPDQTEACELLVAGGGLAGVATAYEALRLGRTVCMTEITDWLGGQLTAQGTSALDEAKQQRKLLYYPRGYNEFRDRIQRYYGRLNPGDCWVSASCFLPQDAQRILTQMLQEVAKAGNGSLKWFPSTVIKHLELSADGKLIKGAIAIQHSPAPGTAVLNAEPLSRILEDAYRYENSPRLAKRIIQFVPAQGKGEGGRGKQGDRGRQGDGKTWMVIDATETGELIALADVPYRLGLDPRTYLDPSSPTETGDPYCVQGHTYTFAMQRTQNPQPQTKPPFYPQYEPYYGYDPNPSKANFEYVFTYRRIWNPPTDKKEQAGPFTLPASSPGSISMQNWVWGNDYRPGTGQDNLIYSRNQLQQTGQLAAAGWLGGLRIDALRKGEEIALGYYYWLVAGTTDSLLQPSQKRPQPNHRLLTGLDSPMGTLHGLSKYPYIREGRRIIGRPGIGYPQGFAISEIDFSMDDFRDEYYRSLPAPMYRNLGIDLAGLDTYKVILENTPPEQMKRRLRSRIYLDSVGISQYAIDFHPCMLESPPEKPGNIERPGVRQAHGQSYPAQIPLRALIPQAIDNLLVAGKGIATSYSAAAAYRVHSFEWSVGAAAGTTAAFALSEGLLPYQLTDGLPSTQPKLEKLQRLLQAQGNPTAFPNTSIFNQNWSEWRVW